MSDLVSPYLVDFQDLCQLSKRKQVPSVIEWCKERGIGYTMDADNRPVTTVNQIDKAIEGAARRETRKPRI